MMVFVSYARQDNGGDALRRIEQQVAALGRPYIDDLQDHRGRDRLAMVKQALESAHVFVAVMSPTYLKTAWTRREFESALHRDIPMMALLADGTLINRSSAQWALWGSGVQQPAQVDVVSEVDQRCLGVHAERGGDEFGRGC